jgi:hypothetical protein
LALGERQRGSIAATFLILAPIVGVLGVVCWVVRVPVAGEASR